MRGKNPDYGGGQAATDSEDAVDIASNSEDDVDPLTLANEIVISNKNAAKCKKMGT